MTPRWVQLLAGVAAMVAVANFQYSWTLFVPELVEAHGWTRVAVGAALNLFFIQAQTWLVPLEGYLAERFGPRRLLVAGGAMAGLAWVVSAYTDSLAVLYAAQAACGCGSGIVYSISMGNSLKWFPDRRGLAAGITAAAFGTGSILTVLPIDYTIAAAGYASAFLWFGLGQGLVIVIASLWIRFPRPGEVPEPPRPKVLQTSRDVAPTEMLRTRTFWLLYLMISVGAIPGLLMVGQLRLMAIDFQLERVEVTILFVTLQALPFALVLDRITGGLTRPVFGWVSDQIGREIAIALAFALEGCSLLALYVWRDVPVMFVLMSGLAFFGWGAIFSLFPAVSCDLFGRRFATTNYGWLYTAKGASALVADLLNRVQANTGSWLVVFVVMIAFDWIAALLALFVLRPMRQRAAATAAKEEDIALVEAALARQAEQG
jgi:OFA family oxalate/formate antiporter-like MFS transporter